MDGNPSDFAAIGTSTADWPLPYVNKTKITSTDHLPTEQASVISLDPHFVLWRDSIATINSDSTKKDDLGNDISVGMLQTDFSLATELKSPVSYLTMLFQNQVQTDQTYIAGTTEVYVVDSTGLPYKYILANPNAANTYQSQLDTYNQKLKDFQNKKIQAAPDYPEIPSLRMTNTDITTASQIYHSYDIALPSACAISGDTLVAQNVSDSDLLKIGASVDGDVYILKDKNHTLNKEEFNDKVFSLEDNNNSFEQVNNGMTPPTFDQYMQKNPLLFVKDYWGRWVILGEFDYQLLGGCGKPVVYLYPQKPTDVSIHFLKPIRFDTDIPTYNGGWNVLAQPDGTLTDLQSQYTDCSSINTRKFGSEYAYQACKNNQYPYLYWAGTSTHATYPAITTGWVVDRDNLATFMNDTLDSAGFTAKEKADFLSYWLPEMLSHNAPYYRISFLQNAEMDQIAPMDVNPMPDHYYRYFLDFLPLQSKPLQPLQPENLAKINRSGFTLVEWGGLLR